MSYVGAAPGTTPTLGGITAPLLSRTPTLYAPTIDGGDVVLAGTGFYISPTGSDSTGTGTIGNPWLTFQAFIDTNPAAGSILYCRGGTYTDDSSVSGHGNGRLIGTSSAPITIRNYPDEVPIFTQSNSEHTAPVLGLASDPGSSRVGTAWVIVDGLRFEDCWVHQTGIIYVGGWETGGNYTWCHDITIRNCYFSMRAGGDQSGHAIYTSFQTDGLTVEYCEMQGPGTTSTVTGSGTGFQLYHTAPINCIVRYNVFNGWKNTSGGCGVQIWDSASTGGQVRHNTFLDNDIDIDARYHGSLTIRDNAFADTGGTTINDPNDSGSTTADHNFTGQTFSSSHVLLPGNSGINAASDGTDAGAIDS